jgi:hypothetical protein
MLAAACWAAAGAAVAAEGPWSLHDALGAPDALTLSGSVRARYETIGGQARPGFGDGEDLLAVRTTLFAEYRTGPLRLGAEVYDSRAYGVDPVTVLSTSDVNALEPVQAYVALDFDQPFGTGSKASLEAGRMMLNLGSRRLVAADDYRNTTNSYTGVKLDAAARGGYAFTGIYVAPQTRLPEDLPSLRKNQVSLDKETDDLRLWAGFLSKANVFGKAAIELEYVGLDERDAPGRVTRNRNLHTYGGRLVRNPEAGRFDYEVEGFWQSGTIRASMAANAPILEVAAGFLHAEAGYQFRDAWKSHLVLEYDIATGDRGAGRFNRFDTLFGMRRADFSPSGLFNAIHRANIETIGARWEFTPSPRWDGFLHANLLWLESATDAFATTAVRDATGRSGSYAGEQFEGRFRYWLVPRSLRFETNVVFLRKGRFLTDAPNAPRTGDTLYGAASVIASF